MLFFKAKASFSYKFKKIGLLIYSLYQLVEDFVVEKKGCLCGSLTL